MSVAEQELETLVRREHANPHAVLGAHPQNGGVVIRALRPTASAITALLEDGSTVELELIHPGGLFQGIVEGAEMPLRYRLEIARRIGPWHVLAPATQAHVTLHAPRGRKAILRVRAVDVVGNEALAGFILPR